MQKPWTRAGTQIEHHNLHHSAPTALHNAQHIVGAQEMLQSMIMLKLFLLEEKFDPIIFRIFFWVGGGLWEASKTSLIKGNFRNISRNSFKALNGNLELKAKISSPMHVSTPGRTKHLVNMIAYCSKYYVSLHPFSLKSPFSFSFFFCSWKPNIWKDNLAQKPVAGDAAQRNIFFPTSSVL